MALAFDGIWVEKYRPKNLEDIVLPSRTKDILTSYKDECPNLLFTSSPGQGKSSLAQILVKDILKCDYLYINASDESGIDTIRYKVINFAQTKSFNGGIKVVILDEACGLTSAGQAILRNVMESHALYTRFILTANHRHKIIPALQSRCQSLDITPTLEGAIKRCCYILKNEGVEVSADQKAKFMELVKANFPDLRKCINELQKNTINGVLTITSVSIDRELLGSIHSKILGGDTLNLRRQLIEAEDRFYGDYDTLMKEYLNYLYNQGDVEDTRKKAMIATIAHHLSLAPMVLDREINAFACWINLERL